MKSNPELLPPPEALRKRGITHVVDNIPEGKELHVSGSVIFQFFDEEIQKRFVKGGQYGSTTDEPTGNGPGK